MPAPVPSGHSFATALDSAITARGLTLDRVRAHLAARGVTLSNATLSYWRRDLRRPESTQSREAVAAIEDILGLPTGALTTTLGPPRPRGRWVNQSDPSRIAALVATLDRPGEGRRALVSAHDVFTVTADGTEAGVRSRIVLRGLGGRVTRHLIRYQSDDPACLPVLSDVDYATTGRIATDPEIGLMVAELILNRPVRGGDYAVLEYEVCSYPSPPVSYYSRTLRAPISEYTQLVRFDGKPPPSCTTYWKATSTSPEKASRQIRMGRSRDSCLVVRDGRLGVIGTGWEW